MKQIILFICVLFTFVSCNSVKNNEADLNNQLVIEKDSYQMIKYFADGGKAEQSTLKFNSNEDYLKWINEQNFSEANYVDLLAIDFDKNDLIIYYLGEKENKNFQLEISNVLYEKTLVEFASKIIAKNEVAISSKKVMPFQLIAVPKNKEIKFNFGM